jgi:hypothetical protein
VNNSIEMSPSYKMIKPHLEWLLCKVVFSSLLFTDEECDDFYNNSSEFVRKVVDPSEDWIDLRTAAINIIQMAARYREKDAMPLIMSLMHDSLTRLAGSPQNKEFAMSACGAYVVMASLSTVRNLFIARVVYSIH